MKEEEGEDERLMKDDKQVRICKGSVRRHTRKSELKEFFR
jgi:hypothetical protein